MYDLAFIGLCWGKTSRALSTLHKNILNSPSHPGQWHMLWLTLFHDETTDFCTEKHVLLNTSTLANIIIGIKSQHQRPDYRHITLFLLLLGAWIDVFCDYAENSLMSTVISLFLRPNYCKDSFSKRVKSHKKLFNQAENGFLWAEMIKED